MRKKRQLTVWYLLKWGSYIILLRLMFPRKTRSDRLEADSRTAEFYAQLREKNPLPKNVVDYVLHNVIPHEIDSSLLAMAIICKKSSNHQLTLKAALFLAEVPVEEHAWCCRVLAAHDLGIFAKGVTIRRRLNAALSVENIS